MMTVICMVLAYALSGFFTIYPLCPLLLGSSETKYKTMGHFDAGVLTRTVFRIFILLVMWGAGIFLVHTAYELHHEYAHYLHNGTETEGVVEQIKKVSDRNGGYTYQHNIKYETASQANVVHIEKSDKYDIGEKVKVVYLKEHPQNAIVVDFIDGTFHHLLLAMMGFAWISIGLSIIIAARIYRKRGNMEYA